jgi:hypothetical protein
MRIINNPVKKNEWFSLWSFAFIAITSFALHFSHFNEDLIGVHIWRQAQTQQNIVNFYRHDFNIFNPRVFNFTDGTDILRYEFPIMQWSIALLIRIFGHPILVTRLSIFLIGLFSILGMYRILKLLSGNEMGSWMGTWLFAFSPVFFYYSINPLPDNMALCAGIWFLCYFFRYFKTRAIRWIYWSAFFLLLATLCKLPYIILSFVAGFYLIARWKEMISYKILLTYFLMLLPALAWYIWVIPGWHDNGVLYGIFRTGSSRYSSILEYHKTTMFPKRLLNDISLVFFFFGLFFTLFYNKFRTMEVGMIISGALACTAYLLLELNMIDTVHDYYMLPFLPFLYIVAGYGVICFWRRNTALKIVCVLMLIEAAAITYQSTITDWSVQQSYSDPNLFLYKANLRNAVPPNEKCVIVRDNGPYVFPYMIDKTGYIVCNEFYSPEQLQDLIVDKKVRYMYSNDRNVDSNEIYLPFIKKQILQRGDIKVFELQPNKHL